MTTRLLLLITLLCACGVPDVDDTGDDDSVEPDDDDSGDPDDDDTGDPDDDDSGDPDPDEPPVHIWVYAHHYLGGGGIYPRAGDLDAMADLVEDLQVPATFFMDGILASELSGEDSTIFDRLTDNPMLEFGYHGEDTHGPYPVPVALLGDLASAQAQSFTYGDDWDTAFAETVSFASSYQSYEFLDPGAPIRELDRWAGGELDTGLPGGLDLVSTVLGEPPVVATFHGMLSPPVQTAFTSVHGVQVLQATPPVSAHGFSQDVPDEVVEAALSLGGDGDLFWYMGHLHTIEREDAELPHSSLTDLQRALDELDRSRPRLVAYLCIIEPGQVAALEEQLTWLRDEFIAANPGSGFVRSAELAGLVTTEPASTVSRSDLLAMAAALDAEFADQRLPRWLETDGHPYSLAEAFDAFAHALSQWSSSGEIPTTVDLHGIIGPIGESNDASLGVARDLAIDDLAGGASDAVASFSADASPARPARVPWQITLDGQDSNPGQLLVGMARALLAIDGAMPTRS